MDSLFDVLDTDKDGLISFQEFVDFVFRTGDRDFLTESEFMKVRELQAAHKEAQKAPVPGEDVRDAQAAQEEQLPVKDASLGSRQTQWPERGYFWCIAYII